MAKKVDPVKAKAARQKKIAIAGGVLLLGLLAFQLPRTMKLLNNTGNVTTSAATTASATTPGSTPLAPPTLEGGSAATAPSGSSGSGGSSVATSDDGVQDPSNPLPASSGQLISFNRFKSKDPFNQQITDCGTGACSASPAPAGAGAGTGTGAATGTTPGGGSGTGAGTTGVTPAGATAGAAAKATTASVSVNGRVERVSVGKSFPAADPVFVLLTLTTKRATIGIAGGSLESGAHGVGLGLGKTLTLQNTADGASYVLRLVRTA
jgi:hypothetical protein